MERASTDRSDKSEKLGTPTDDLRAPTNNSSLTAVDADVPTFMGLSGKRLNLVVSTVATCGFLLFGYDQGVMSGIISADDFNDYFPQTKDNDTWQAFVTSIYEIGCLLGAILVLTVGDRLGRRKCIKIGSAIMVVGVLIQVTAIKGHSATAQFIIGRTITGFGNGMNTSTIPTYQAECSRTTNRGLLICIEGGIIAIGSMIAYWIDYGASYGPANFTWRFPIAFQIVFGIFVFSFTWFLPESPRWLLTKDRPDEAYTVLAALRGVGRNDHEVQVEVDSIKDAIRIVEDQSGGFRDLFTGGKTQHCRRMLIGVTAQMGQQLTGCNAVIYYFPILFEQSIGQSKNISLLLGGVNMIVYASFATTSWFIIERVGRRKIFLWGLVGQGLSMVLVFGALIPGTESAAKGAAVGLFTFVASFGATWLPLPWLYPAEINPIQTRARANAVSTCSNWLWNFFVVMITPVLISKIGWGTYLFFAAMNAVFFPIVWFFYPETARRSLEGIDLIFAKGYKDNTSYVKAARDLPLLSDEETEIMTRKYADDIERRAM